MTTAEITDRLCSIVAGQAAFIRELVLFIENQLAVDDEIKKDFAGKEKRLNEELDLVETGLFPSGEREA